MTNDPKDAEIARLVAELTRAPGWPTLARRAVDAIKGLTAERDAALAQVAGAYADAAKIVADSYIKEVVSLRTPADALAARDRRDARMRAEGMRTALDVVSENADWPEDEHGRTEHPALFARISHAILAAAEKEASNG